jgi:REP element-mobilizing transposase RayT
MARAVRMDFPNTFYHVLSRGNERRSIFYDRGDYSRFLETLGRMVERFQIEVHGYVLMPNHFHLLVRTLQANLSRAVQWLGVSYSVWFNKRHDRCGHVFQGRFKSFVIENEHYFTALILYVHGNPLRAKLVKELSEYRWSSYRGYLREGWQEAWLKTDTGLSVFGGNRRRFREAQEFQLGRRRSVLEDLRYGMYLGTEEYAEECLRKLKDENYREKPQIRRMLEARDIEEVLKKVLKGLGQSDIAPLLASGKTRNLTRDMAIYSLRKAGIFTNQEIGRVFGVGYTAVTEAAKRAEAYLSRNGNNEMRERIQKIDF